MFIQARTPFRDANTGKYIREGKAILLRYLRSWFLIDLLSVVPFELVNMGKSTDAATQAKGNLGQLRLLRFLRLMRLLKLLRVLRASRKLKQWRVYIDVRYTTLQLCKVRDHFFAAYRLDACVHFWKRRSDCILFANHSLTLYRRSRSSYSFYPIHQTSNPLLMLVNPPCPSKSYEWISTS